MMDQVLKLQINYPEIFQRELKRLSQTLSKAATIGLAKCLHQMLILCSNSLSIWLSKEPRSARPKKQKKESITLEVN